jgi:hypothetical protein
MRCQLAMFWNIGLIALEGMALLLLTTSGVLPIPQCSRQSETGMATMALYFVQVGSGGACVSVCGSLVVSCVCFLGADSHRKMTSDS